MSAINFNSLPPLGKSYILDYITEEEIFEFYLELKVIPNHHYHSPFREKDDFPTANYYYSKDDGRLRFQDWNGNFHGDCYDAVARKKRIAMDASDKEVFREVINQIAFDFRLHKYADDKEYIRVLYNAVVREKKKINKETKIDYIPRDYLKKDAKFWTDRYGLVKNDLIDGLVIPASAVYINGRIESDEKERAYVYDFGEGKIRVYYPDRGRGDRRFITNTGCIQGLNTYQVSRVGLLIKSYKDVLVLRKLCRGRFDIDGFAPPGESAKLTKEEVSTLKGLCDWMACMYDFEYAGVVTANYNRYVHGLKTFFLTNGRFKTINYRSKDLSDFLEYNGEYKTLKLIEAVYNRHETFMDAYDREVYQDMKWIYDEYREYRNKQLA